MGFSKAFSFAFLLLLSLTTFAQTNLNKADKQYELFAFNLAIQSYLTAIEKEPYQPETLARLADCYRNLNQMDQAETWYAKAVAAKELAPVHFFNYGQVLMAQGKHEEAKKMFLKFAETDPVTGNYYAENCTFAATRINEPSAYKVTTTTLNSTASDFAPAFFKDNLVFASARTDIKKASVQAGWTGDAQNRVFMASLDKSGALGTPKILHADIRSAYNEGPLAYSPDNKIVIFTKNNFVDGTRHIPSSGMQLSLFFAEVDENGDWSDPKPFPHNGTGYSTGFPSFSPDGNTLYFASDRPDGFGGYDLYACNKFGNTWTAPENLGSVINTKGNEITPFLDGKHLFFASDWHTGFGGYDIFRAEKSNFSWDKIFHLGSTVNSPRDDYGFIFNRDINKGFFTSNRVGGKGMEDIYAVSKLTGEIIISVVNASDGKPLQGVTADFSGCGEGKFETNDQGKVIKQAKEGMKCAVTVWKDGFLAETIKITTEGFQSSQSFDVILKNQNETYSGSVLSANNNAGLADVTVKVTNQSSGLSTTTSTDASGKYTLALTPHSSYVVRYSKVGYFDLNQTVKTGDGKDKSIVGTTQLMPTTMLVSNPPKSEERSITPATVKKEPAPSTPTPIKEKEVVITAKDVPVMVPKGKGYSVQIASMNLNATFNVNEMETKTSGIGPLYLVESGNAKKLRVGVFPTKEAAEKARTTLVERGFADAFLVAENPPAVEPSPAKTDVETKAMETKTISNVKIRLAAVRETKWFDSSNVSDIGSIELKKSGEWTVILIGGFSNMDAAKAGLQKAKSVGYQDAYLVTDENGELKKVN